MADAQITSLRNTHILEVKSLAKRSQRDKSVTFLVEGKKEILMALKYGYECLKSFCIDEAIWLEVDRKRKFIVSGNVLEKISYRKDSEPVALFRQKEHSLNVLKVKQEEPFFSLLIERVEKPGNLGAMMRTADAAGVDCIFLTDAVCDIYNPNVIRASLGTLFTKRIVLGSTVDITNWLKKNSVELYSTTPYATKAHNEVEYTKRCCISVGSESEGHSKELLKASDQHILIPMKGVIDSLNVSVAAALVLYEVMKQR